MKAFDCVNKQEVEVTKEGLIDFMKKDRQIDMKFAEKRTDDMGYLTWDAENWTCVDGQNKFMRCYSLEGRVLRDSKDSSAVFFLSVFLTPLPCPSSDRDGIST